MPSAVVAALHRYPVKSMLGESIARAALGATGIPGDRAWAVCDGKGVTRGAKRFPELMRMRAQYVREPSDGERSPEVEIGFPDGSRSSSGTGGIDAELTARLGCPVSLRAAAEGESFFDAFALLIMSTTSIASLQALAATSRIDVRRFRPNILVTMDGTGFPEFAWPGQTLVVGGSELEVQMACPRCVMTTQATGDLPDDPEVLRALVANTDGNLGVYATVTHPGTIRVGDAVETSQ